MWREHCTTRRIKAEPRNAQARMNRAILHFLNGDLKDGWRDYAARTEVPGKVPVVAGEQRLAPWTGENLKKKRLLVRTRTGRGRPDPVRLPDPGPGQARAEADGGSVVLECEPRLQTLFARSFPGVTVKPAALKTRERCSGRRLWLAESRWAASMPPP